MHILTGTTTKLTLTEIKRLDAVNVYLDDIGKSRGRIVIECFGEAWSSFWPAMGDRSIAQFFVDCNTHYLAKNLDSQLKDNIPDYDALYRLLNVKISEHKKNKTLDIEAIDHARWVLESEESSFSDEDGHHWCQENADILYQLLGDDWYHDIPEKSNPDYVYLCRIIEAVRDGLTEHLKTATNSSQVPA
jgi:hypothetical protein